MIYNLLLKLCKHETHVNMSIVNACSLVCYFFEVVREHSPRLLLCELMIQAQTTSDVGAFQPWPYKHATTIT